MGSIATTITHALTRHVLSAENQYISIIATNARKDLLTHEIQLNVRMDGTFVQHVYHVVMMLSTTDWLKDIYCQIALYLTE